MRGMLDAARAVAFSVLVLLATGQHAQARQGVPAREWLSTLRFTVLHLDIPINGVGWVNMSNLVLSNATLGSITSEWYPDASASTSDKLQVALTQLTFSMAGHWHADVFGLSAEGNVSATLKDTQMRVVERIVTTDDKKRFDGLECAGCDANVTIVDPSITGSVVAAILDVLANVFTRQLATALSSRLCKVVANALTFNVTNDSFPSFHNDHEQSQQDDTQQMGVVDLQKSILVDAAQYLLNNVSRTTPALSLNSIVSMLANNSDGFICVRELLDKFQSNRSSSFKFNDIESSSSSSKEEEEEPKTPLFTFHFEPEKLPLNITLGVWDIDVSGLNTWHNTDMVRPRTRRTLWSFAQLARFGANVSFYLNVTSPADGSSRVANENYLWEEGVLVFLANNNSAQAVLRSVAYGDVALQYSNRQCVDPQCIEALFDANKTHFVDIVLNTTLDALELRLRSGGFEEDVSHLVSMVFALVRDNCAAMVPQLVNAAVRTNFMGVLNRAIGAELDGTACPALADPVVADIQTGVTTGVALVFALLFAAIAALPSAMRWGTTRRSNDEQGALLPGADKAEPQGAAARYCWPPKLGSAMGRFLREFGRTDEEGASLFMHPRTGALSRHGVVLLGLVCLGLFVSAHTGLGATLSLMFQVGSTRSIDVHGIQDFDVTHMVSTAWMRHNYPNAVASAVYFVALPYVLLAALFVCWFWPASYLGTKARYAVLVGANCVAKVLVVGQLINIIIFVAVNVSKALPVTNPALAEHPFVILLHIDPTYGFIALLCATVVLLVLSYVVLSSHRALRFLRTTGLREPLPALLQLRWSSAPGCSRKPLLSWALVVGGLAALVCCVVALNTRAFTVHYQGLLGLVVGALDAQPDRTYSATDIVRQFAASLSAPTSFSAYFGQAFYVAVVFLFPALDLVTTLVCACCPMKPLLRKLTYYVCENFRALALADILGVSLVVAVLQIRRLIRRLSELYCAPINPFVDTLFRQQFAQPGLCAQVEATVDSGTVLLICAASAMTATSAFLQHRMRTQLYARQKAEQINSVECAQVEDGKSSLLPC